ASGQTISQPYIVALMLEALDLDASDRVLDVGTGSGYAAALLAEMVADVYSIERVAGLADSSRRLLEKLGYRNIMVIHGDGSVGWPQAQPYNGIVVAAGGPHAPEALKQQLQVGGHLVIPVGESGSQGLMRITRIAEDKFDQEQLSRVRFVPLIGKAGWDEHGRHASTSDHPDDARDGGSMGARGKKNRQRDTIELLADIAEPIGSDSKLDSLLERIGDSRVVLIGEASHGTSEFYRFRARITRQLIERKGFNIVATESDWPDAARVDHYVRELTTPPSEWRAFARFPAWMWRNTDVQEFVDWLRRHNAGIPTVDARVGFYGLDLYSMYTSIEEVLSYLDSIDSEAAAEARQRYSCLMPWEKDPATYGRAVTSGRHRECQREVVDILTALMERQLEYSAHDGDSFLNAVQNARLVANAEEYYRSLYDGYADSWNLRDTHMFDTLTSLLEYRGDSGKIVVWEHNSHIGDAAATDMSARGQHNVGQLCRQAFGDDAYLIGMGTHTGTVAAANDWGRPMKVMNVTPSLAGSWERLFHDTGIPAFIAPVRHHAPRELHRRLVEERPERAIGVIYRPRTERASHYFHARLGDQFDEYVWFDETTAVTPLGERELEGAPDTYPFGL
ncbi:MAG: protein-L-isoaspartate O-methyltransferase, partial [Haliea sp.]